MAASLEVTTSLEATTSLEVATSLEVSAPLDVATSGLVTVPNTRAMANGRKHTNHGMLEMLTRYLFVDFGHGVCAINHQP